MDHNPQQYGKTPDIREHIESWVHHHEVNSLVDAVKLASAEIGEHPQDVLDVVAEQTKMSDGLYVTAGMLIDDHEFIHN